MVDEGSAATSMPRRILPPRAAVNWLGSILNWTVETWPAVVTDPGMIANVLPIPALKSWRSSSVSSETFGPRFFRGCLCDGLIRPSLAFGREKSDVAAKPHATDQSEMKMRVGDLATRHPARGSRVILAPTILDDVKNQPALNLRRIVPTFLSSGQT